MWGILLDLIADGRCQMGRRWGRVEAFRFTRDASQLVEENAPGLGEPGGNSPKP